MCSKSHRDTESLKSHTIDLDRCLGTRNAVLYTPWLFHVLCPHQFKMNEASLDSPVTIMPNANGLKQTSFQLLGLKKRVLILGDGKLAHDLARVLVYDRSHRYDVTGFLSGEQARVGTSLVTPTIIGTIDQLFAISERYHVQTRSEEHTSELQSH